MKRIISTISIFLVMVFWTCSASALETTMIVKLHRDIKHSVKNLGRLQDEHNRQMKDLNRQMEQIKQEFQVTNNPDRKDYLAKLYFKLRAQQLALEAKDYAKMHDILGNTILKMDNLQRLMGNKGDISPFSEEDKKIVSNVMVGAKNLFYTIQTLEPNNPRLARLSYNIKMLDRGYKQFFSPQRRTSLQEQINFLSDLAAFTQAFLSFLEEERNNILQKIYFLIQNDLYRDVHNLDLNFDVINKEFAFHHNDDETIINGVLESSPENNIQPVSLENVGNY